MKDARNPKMQLSVKMTLRLFTLFLFSNSAGFSQDTSLRTYSGKSVDSNTCVYQIRLVDLLSIDTLHNEVRKPKIERLVKYLSSCDPKYRFDTTYQDKEFRLIIPKYLSEISYELGDQHFAIVLRDTTSYQRTIVFTYDLNDNFKNYFLSRGQMKESKVMTIKSGDHTLYRFLNWDERNAGTIFTSNHLFISYFTKSKAFEPELEEVIANFKW